MTPTPSHVDTDELIETLERRRTKSMAFEREHGLDGIVTLSIDEASALISALKENKRLREALEEIASSKTTGLGDQWPTYGRLAMWELARAALQPQGEK